jgi:hypothetical protein
MMPIGIVSEFVPQNEFFINKFEILVYLDLKTRKLERRNYFICKKKFRSERVDTIHFCSPLSSIVGRHVALTSRYQVQMQQESRPHVEQDDRSHS